MEFEILLSKLLRLPIKKIKKMYERTIDNDNLTFAEHIRASDTFESKVRYMNMVKEEAYFELMLALTQMSIGKNRVSDELFKELKGYPMVLWMEVIGELDAKSIHDVLHNYGKELSSALVETLIINLPKSHQASTIEKYKSSLDSTSGFFDSFYYCLCEEAQEKVRAIFPNSIKPEITHLLELKDVESGLIGKRLIEQKNILKGISMDSIIELLLLKTKNVTNMFDVLKEYSDRIDEISDMRFKLLVGRLRELLSNEKGHSLFFDDEVEVNKSTIQIFNLLKPKFRKLGLKETLELMDSKSSSYYDNKTGNEIIYQFLDIAYKGIGIEDYINEQTIKALIERFENDCSKKEYTVEDFKRLVEKTTITKPQKLIHDDYIEAMIACRKLMKNNQINNKDPYYIELKNRLSNVLNDEVIKDGTTAEHLNTDALFYRLVKGTIDFASVFNIKTYKGLAYTIKANKTYEDPDTITTYLTDEQVAKLDITPIMQWQKVKIKEALKQKDQNMSDKEVKLKWVFNERLALQLLCYFGEQKARHIIKSDMRVNRMEHLFDNIDYKRIQIDENGSPIINEDLVDFFFGKGSVKEKNSIMNKLIREEIPEFDSAVSELCNNYEEVKEACHGILTVKRVINYYDDKSLPIELKPHQYAYKKALKEMKYIDEDKLTKAVALCDDAAKRKYSTIPKIKGDIGDFTYEILDLKDSMHVASGYLSHCCFIIDGISYSSLKHSMQSKNGRILFVYHKGAFLGQSWLWRNGDVICLDSVEAGSARHGAYEDNIKLVDVYKKIAEEIINKSKANETKEERVKIVTMGKSDFRFEGLEDLKTEKTPRPLERDCYVADSYNQRILAGEMPENPRYGEVIVKYRDPRKKVYQILDMKDANIDYLDEAILKLQGIKYQATGNEEVEDETTINQLFVGDDWYIKTTKDGDVEVEIIDDDEETITECRRYAEVLGVKFKREYDRNDNEILPKKEEIIKTLKLLKKESRRG